MKSAPTLLARKPAQPGISAAVLLLLFSALLLPAGCSRRGKAQENAYVTAPQVYLRDRIAAVYNRVTLVKNGERVQVLEHSRRFVRVRAGDGKEGWVEERYLAGQDVFDQTEQLASANRNTPLVATGITENDTNIH
ncbi:MAG TPA: SH3 domain-containing protein, partial [Terriglobales bacterium]